MAIIVLTMIGAGLNYYAASSLGIVKDSFVVNEMSPLAFLISMLVFLLAKNLSPRLVANKLFSAIAAASFGMYLIHEIFNGIFYNILPDYYSHGLIYIPTVVVLTTILSFISIYLLRKIPFIKAVC
jgi:surface polysaccharide O-acyltransferase-like enzyme